MLKPQKENTNSPAMRQLVGGPLEAKFKITHQGVLKEFLGMECGWKVDADGRKYFDVNQRKYLEKILQ